jgi:transcriptional regulator with XRE-family HTH domain
MLSLSDGFPMRHNDVMVENTPKPRPNLLHAWRTHRGLSQVELAEKVGTSHQVIGYLERGRTELSAKWLLKLADALNTTPGHLLSVDPANVDNDIIDIWSRIPERERANALKAIRGFVVRTGTDD